jgi:hypothetical protein
MYQIFHNGVVTGSFIYFFDAWVTARINYPDYTCISGPDGVWFGPRWN